MITQIIVDLFLVDERDSFDCCDYHPFFDVEGQRSFYKLLRSKYSLLCMRKGCNIWKDVWWYRTWRWREV